ncbi:HNH endonuclease [Mycobacteroides abscessus]|uniref:HNH endonuclease n=1 Tax=Mycobacteroides abscessus TaxID=36809 RepID=UPI0009A6F889|nr:HNH endonuclease signature motif containing protein [Mycobacteroides abscessus]SLC01563.1 HNH endonuclease [Mycobacteroides abscessus subsp. abscessus]SLG08821.1 HNH endonuclease [Mycobacteroides abscessus subsp. abscessus]
MATIQRNTTTRDKHRRIIKLGLPPSPFGRHPACYHCGEDIDYDAHHLDDLSFTIDHLKALAKGGTDTLDNIVPAHRGCNRTKSDKDIDELLPGGVTFATERCWWS